MKLRSLFSTATVLAFLAGFAVAFALMKLEMNARFDFLSKTAVARSLINQAVPELRRELFTRWMDVAKSNPTFSTIPKELLYPEAFVGNQGSSEAQAGDYFGSDHSWRVCLSQPHLSAETDFSQIPFKLQYDKRIDVEIICSRPCSLFSRQTSVKIVDKGAPDDASFLQRLDVGFSGAGIPCNIVRD